MHKDLSSLKNAYDSIEVPPELDLVIEKAVRKGRKAKITRRVFNPMAAAAALILIFVFSVNLSPAFARYISNVPGMEPLINLLSFDKGLVYVVDHGFGQIINKSATDNGITVTVENAIYDGRKVILAVKIESDKVLQRLGAIDYDLYGAKVIKGSVSSHHEENTQVFDKLLEFELQVNHEQVPQDFIFRCNSIEHIYDTPEGSLREAITGDWSIFFTLDTELAKYEPKQTEINKVVSVGDAQFTVESMKIYPTVINLRISGSRDTALRITGFRNPRLIDEDGNVYDFKSSVIGDYDVIKRDYETILSFESNYFVNSAHLSFVIDGVYTIPKKDTYFVLNIDDGRVINDGGLGVEFLRKNTSMDSTGDGERLNVWFKVSDREFAMSEPKFLWIDHTVKDMLDKPYPIIFIHSSTGLKDEFAISFDAEQPVPNVIKVRIVGVSKGAQEKVRVKLK